MRSTWRARIASQTPHATFAPPVSEADVVRARAALGGELAADLQALLRESDGVRAEYGLGLVWPLARIVERCEATGRPRTGTPGVVVATPIGRLTG